MKITQILYLLLLVLAVYWIVTSTHLLETSNEGFEDMLQTPDSEPVIPKGLTQAKIDSPAEPNPSIPGELPFGPYAQTASVGSYQYQDPAQLPANLEQMRKLFEDLRSFLVFEGVSLNDSSDPTVQLPLTQLRADSRKLEQEIATLNNNPGIQSQITQQGLADIDGALIFLQKKVRLFTTSGVISEGFHNPEKTRATKLDVDNFRVKIYAAILKLSASGTVDPVVQARIKNLQAMYTKVSDILIKVNDGSMNVNDIPLYKEDIQNILPNLAKPANELTNPFGQNSGKVLSPIEKQLASLVGEENAPSVFNSLRDKGSFRINFELGYNNSQYKRKYELDQNGLMKDSNQIYPHSVNNESNSSSESNSSNKINEKVQMNLPFDSTTPGMDDRHSSKNPSRFDWKERAQTICEQVKRRGLNPEDFGCIPKGSLMSPAYSWRGHSKMICGRLGATMDPDLPIVCGCPPQGWKGWTLSV